MTARIIRTVLTVATPVAFILLAAGCGAPGGALPESVTIELPDGTTTQATLGSGVATEMALETKARALILEAPFTSIGDMAQRRFPFFPARWLVLDRFDTIGKIGRVGIPVLVLHGERDGVTPTELGRRVYAAAGEPKRLRVFPDAGHVDLFEHGADRAVVEFVAEVVEE